MISGDSKSPALRRAVLVTGVLTVPGRGRPFGKPVPFAVRTGVAGLRLGFNLPPFDDNGLLAIPGELQCKIFGFGVQPFADDPCPVVTAWGCQECPRKNAQAA